MQKLAKNLDAYIIPQWLSIIDSERCFLMFQKLS